jgi:hypothetical protein
MGRVNMGYPTNSQIDDMIAGQRRVEERAEAERRRVAEEVRTYPALYCIPEPPRRADKPPKGMKLAKVIQVAREAVLGSAGHGKVGREAADAVEKALRERFEK